MIDPGLIKDYEHNGACIVPGVLSAGEIQTLRAELIRAIDEDLEQYPTAFDAGMVHNCMFRGKAMRMLLDQPIMNAYLAEVLAPSSILYAYQSSSLAPQKGNYGSRIHVDSPRFVPGYTTNVGVIFPLDDFTKDNGATYYLPGSHLIEELADEETFFAGAHRLIAQAGDMILFHARLAHSAGKNTTDQFRHALTLNCCRCFMRQRFDFARMISEEHLKELGEDGKRLIGWNVRMPTSLEEFYLPPESRLYKPGQE